MYLYLHKSLFFFLFLDSLRSKAKESKNKTLSFGAHEHRSIVYIAIYLKPYRAERLFVLFFLFKRAPPNQPHSTLEQVFFS